MEPSIGRRILFHLARLGRTQAWLARSVGCSEAAVSQWCLDRNEPSLASLRLVIAALGMTEETFFAPLDEPAEAAG